MSFFSIPFKGQLKNRDIGIDGKEGSTVFLFCVSFLLFERVLGQFADIKKNEQESS